MTTNMHYNTIRVSYVPFQCDVRTKVVVRDHFGNITEASFEYDWQANEYLKALPGDYFIRDARDKSCLYVRDFREANPASEARE